MFTIAMFTLQVIVMFTLSKCSVRYQLDSCVWVIYTFLLNTYYKWKTVVGNAQCQKGDVAWWEAAFFCSFFFCIQVLVMWGSYRLYFRDLHSQVFHLPSKKFWKCSNLWLLYVVVIGARTMNVQMVAVSIVWWLWVG